jgi:hypothetical protein
MRLTRNAERMAQDFDSAITEALNETGDAVVREITDDISRDTGITIAEAAGFVTPTRATKGNNKYVINIHAGMVETDRVSRRLPSRVFDDPEGDPDRIFGQAVLAKVITAGDNKVCEICERISEEGPYSADELRGLKDQHPHFLNPQLGCRCALQSFEASGRIGFQAKQGQSKIDTKGSLGQLAAQIRANVRTVLRAKSAK